MGNNDMSDVQLLFGRKVRSVGCVLVYKQPQVYYGTLDTYLRAPLSRVCHPTYAQQSGRVTGGFPVLTVGSVGYVAQILYGVVGSNAVFVVDLPLGPSAGMQQPCQAVRQMFFARDTDGDIPFFGRAASDITYFGGVGQADTPRYYTSFGIVGEQVRRNSKVEFGHMQYSSTYAAETKLNGR